MASSTSVVTLISRFRPSSSTLRCCSVRRRCASIARFLAVVISQPAGLGGMPVTGHCSKATTRESWASSSASPTSLVTRANPAISRPDSIRQTASTARLADASSEPFPVMERIQQHLPGTALDATDENPAPAQAGVEFGNEATGGGPPAFQGSPAPEPGPGGREAGSCAERLLLRSEILRPEDLEDLTLALPAG